MHKSAIDRKVTGLAHNSKAKAAAARHGLDIVNVSWEDNGRSKGSCWGPCISDMTLSCRNNLCPAVRYPNFSDLTFDIPTDLFTVMVGNEKDNMLRPVSLKEYLTDINQFITPGSANKKIPSLFNAKKDKEVLVSAQSTFLPADTTDNPEFDVKLFNYQTYSRDDPHVLTILATSHGTSAQLLRDRAQPMFHNANGKALHHKAMRLSAHRNDGKATNLQTTLTKEEKAMNVLMVIQVPIVTINKPKQQVRRKGGASIGAMGGLFGGMGAPSGMGFLKKCAKPRSCGSGAPPPPPMIAQVASSGPSAAFFAPPPPPAPAQMASSATTPNDMLGFDECEGSDSCDDDFCEEEFDMPSQKGSEGECDDFEMVMDELECQAESLAACSQEFSCEARKKMSKRSSRRAEPKRKPEKKVGTGSEHAILKLGGSAGRFPTFEDVEFTRDDRFPLRVTMQFYKVSDTDDLSDADFKSMVDQIKQARSAATAVGSLVVDGATGRSTEHTATAVPVEPTWWDSFYMTHRNKITSFGLSEREALIKITGVMGNCKFSSMSDTERAALSALGLPSYVQPSPAVFTSALF